VAKKKISNFQIFQKCPKFSKISKISKKSLLAIYSLYIYVVTHRWIVNTSDYFLKCLLLLLWCALLSKQPNFPMNCKEVRIHHFGVATTKENNFVNITAKPDRKFDYYEISWFVTYLWPRSVSRLQIPGWPQGNRFDNYCHAV
jgi:hypothetical protein